MKQRAKYNTSGENVVVSQILFEVRHALYIAPFGMINMAASEV